MSFHYFRRLRTLTKVITQLRHSKRRCDKLLIRTAHRTIRKMDNSKSPFETAKQRFGGVVGGLKNLKWESIPEPARKYIEAHPKLTALQVVLVLLTLCPGLVVAPVLGFLGFSSIGPVAGK